VILTGSNSKLLSTELGTHLTGRYIQTTIYPFSFGEFLKAKKFDLNTQYLVD
jgi:predicted AAA+ superfamily ATPase